MAALSDGSPRRLRFLHFNDVYNVDASSRGEVCGGAARFSSLVKSYFPGGSRYDAARGTPLVVFGGDAFNPSIMSTVTKGRQMIPVLESLHIAAACYGNHDFDFGVDHLLKLKAMCSFPWLLSNVKVRATGKQMADGIVTHMVTHEETGLRVGFMGLIEDAWMATLATVDAEDVDYEDFVACAKRLSAELRASGADLVVAITHMRVPNDNRLAAEAGYVIDLILGGHDHHYEVRPTEPHKDVWLCKSGTDFRDLTVLDMVIGGGGRGFTVENAERVQITRDMPEDDGVIEALREYQEKVAGDMQKTIGATSVDLDARFSAIRTRETNISNFVADCVRHGSRTPAGVAPDIALINAGTLRADRIMKAGALVREDLVALLPMLDPMVILELTTDQLMAVLENAVSQWPALEGRFACVSGVTFAFRTGAPPGQRIVRESVRVGDRPLDGGGGAAGGPATATTYTLATKQYLAKGKDGYLTFADCPVLVDEEEMAPLGTMVRRYFQELAVVNAFRSPQHGDECVFSRRAAALVREKFSTKVWQNVSAIHPEVEGRIREE
jgi:5'-nucleotidase